MEIAALAALPVLLVAGVELDDLGGSFRFIVPFFQDHLGQLMVISGIFGVLRVLGAAALLRDRVWGAALSLTLCVVTLVLMIFLLPAGLVDGLLSGAALVLILQGLFGSSRLTESAAHAGGAVERGPRS